MTGSVVSLSSASITGTIAFKVPVTRNIVVKGRFGIRGPVVTGVLVGPSITMQVVGIEKAFKTTCKIYLSSKEIRADGTSLLLCAGPRNRAVTWSVLVGYGVITPFTNYTDEHGIAYALYNPLGLGTGPLKIQVLCGA